MLRRLGSASSDAHPRRVSFWALHCCFASSIWERYLPSASRVKRCSNQTESLPTRLPANQVLQDKIGYLLKRPIGRPPYEVRRYYASFRYQAQSWNRPRHVVAKVEWHPGESYPRVGFIVTNLARSTEGIVAFYNQRGTCEQYIKEGKNAIKWT